MRRNAFITTMLFAATLLGWGSEAASAQSHAHTAMFQFSGNMTAPVPAVDGTGNFTFTGTVGDACVASHSDDSFDLDCSGGSFVASGTFDSLVCGTGQFEGRATINGLLWYRAVSADFTITFVAGQGVI